MEAEGSKVPFVIDLFHICFFFSGKDTLYNSKVFSSLRKRSYKLTDLTDSAHIARLFLGSGGGFNICDTLCRVCAQRERR